MKKKKQPAKIKKQPKIKEKFEISQEPILRALSLSFSNIWRNKFLSLATIIVMAILIFIFNMVLGINFVAQNALSDLTQKVDIVVYLNDNVEYYQVQQMINEMKKVDGIIEVNYTSKNEALDTVSKTHPRTADFLSRYGVENPLPPSINVRTEKPEYHIVVQNFINQDIYRPLLAKVDSGNAEKTSAMEAVTNNLLNLSNTTQQISYWVFILFIFGSVLIISNSIQLTIYNRQREIYIMRLVGATKNFIRLPFLFEGLLYGLIAMIFAAGLIWAVFTQITIAEININSYINDIPFITIFFIELAVSGLLGIVCSFIAVYRYLKTKLILE